MIDSRAVLVQAARVTAHSGLVDAFGHVSSRVGPDLLITAPIPLAFQRPEDLNVLSLDAIALPPGVPREAWIHIAIARADPTTGAICRAQPQAVSQAVAAGRRLRPLDGHGALLGPLVPVYDDSRLVRDAASGRAVAGVLADAPAIVLRGNGAVTRGPDLASAVARMWLLERSARLALAANGDAPPLPAAEQEWWRERHSELLPRIYEYLVRVFAEHTASEQGRIEDDRAH